jgi:hypothetical protein
MTSEGVMIGSIELLDSTRIDCHRSRANWYLSSGFIVES